MPTQAPSRFHVTLKDPKTEQRQFVTLSRVPCPKCNNSPFARGGYEREDGFSVPACSGCNGSGDVPATAESAAAFLEAQERERVKFRLDEAATLGKYGMTMPHNALEVVEQTVLHFPKDAHTVNGFYRAGKVVRNPGHADPSMPYQKAHKGWRAFHEQERPFKVMKVGRMAEEMVVTGGQFGVPLKNLYTGANLWDWDTDTIKSAFSTASYVYNIDTHDFFNDVTNELSTAGNYTAGGFTLASAASSYDTTTDQVRLDAADISQASATFSFQIITTYKSTGTSSTSPLICFLDAGGTVAPSAGTLTVTWDATGIFVHDIT